MSKNKLAIIGGSGLYDVEEFKERELLDIQTSWILLIDADEVVPDLLWSEISECINKKETADKEKSNYTKGTGALKIKLDHKLNKLNETINTGMGSGKAGGGAPMEPAGGDCGSWPFAVGQVRSGDAIINSAIPLNGLRCRSARCWLFDFPCADDRGDAECRQQSDRHYDD